MKISPITTSPLDTPAASQAHSRASIQEVYHEQSSERLRMPKYAMEQGQVGGAESTASGKRNLGNSRSLGNLRQGRDLALFNLATGSKLRGCDLVQLRVHDVCHGGHVAARASVMQQKTKQPVQFELTAGTRKSLEDWIAVAALRHGDFLFSSRISESPHISTRQYARIVHQWFDEIGLDPTAYSTHTMRRTKPTLIYRRTKNLRAVQLLLGHTRLESTVRYLGIEVDDALEMAEQTDA